MSFSSLAIKNSECGNDVLSKTINLPVACFPEFSKQVRSLVQEYYNGECKLEARLLFKGSGSISKGNLSLGYLTSPSQNLSENSSSNNLKTDNITDPYSCYSNKIKNKKSVKCISTASNGISITDKSEDIENICKKKYLSTVECNPINTQKLSLKENSNDTTCKTSPKVFNKLRIYAHPDFMNSTTTNKISVGITNENGCSKYSPSKNVSSAPIFDDIKLIFCRNADIYSFNSYKSLTPISFDTNGSPKRHS